MIQHRLAVLALAACGLMLVCVRGAQASPTDLYGGFPRGMATAGTQTAAADDNGAALYNPAGIALAGQGGKASFQLGYEYAQPVMHLDRQTNNPGSPQTRNPPEEGWLTLSATAPLGGKLKYRASFGFAAYIPQNNLIRVQSLDPKTPQWLRYQSDPDRLVMAVGLGVKITDWLSVGAGGQLLAGFSGTMQFDIDLATRQVANRNLDFNLSPGFAPIVGVTVTPIPALRFGLMYKGALFLHVNLPQSDINISGLGIALGISGTVLYTPQELAFGGQWSVTDRLKLAVDLKYDWWSQAPFPGLGVQVTPTGPLAAKSGLGLGALGFGTPISPTNFQNTLTPSASVEYTLPGPGIVLRGGYALRPPYAPIQVGPTNFLDAMTHVIGLGATFQFHDPLEIFASPIKVDLGMEGQFCQTVTVTKAESGDPVGNYSYGGFALGGGVALRYEF